MTKSNNMILMGRNWSKTESEQKTAKVRSLELLSEQRNWGLSGEFVWDSHVTNLLSTKWKVNLSSTERPLVESDSYDERERERKRERERETWHIDRILKKGIIGPFTIGPSLRVSKFRHLDRNYDVFDDIDRKEIRFTERRISSAFPAAKRQQKG